MTDEATINPDVLRWAREVAGYTVEEAAECLKIKNPVKRLHSFEEGESVPSLPQLRRLARLYDRPLVIFFMDGPPDEVIEADEFRTLQGEKPSQFGPNLRRAMRTVSENREVALDLAPGLGDITTLGVTAKVTDDPEVVGGKLREALDIKKKKLTLSEWKSAVEGLGVLVSEFSGVRVKEARGFAIAEHPFPAIALNNGDSKTARCFTLMHELAHLVLGDGPVVVNPWASEPNKAEVWCNAVAAAVLVPKSRILAEPEVTEESQGWPDETLDAVGKRYGVSREVVFRRLVTLKKATHEEYGSRRKAFLAFYAQLREAEKEAMKAKEGAPSYYRVTASKLGRSFTRMVLDAYDVGGLTLASTSRILGVKAKNMTGLQKEIRGA